MNGYSPELIAIDDQMVALGRPVPPVVSWMSGGLKGDFNARTAAWRTQLAAWEQTNSDDAVTWLELRERYRAQEELEESTRWDPDEWNYELLGRIGAPRRSLECIRRKFDDKAAMKAANDWARVGTEWCLVLTGGPGCGKTTAATWAAHQLMMRNFRPRWVDCPSMVDAPMFGPEAELKKFRAREAGVLVLDDLASTARERDLAKAPAPWLDWLDNVLAHRHGQRKKTIITSNRSQGWLAKWLGDRLADRLNEGTIHSTSEKSMRVQREPGSEG